jgi:hypothetical protein
MVADPKWSSLRTLGNTALDGCLRGKNANLIINHPVNGIPTFVSV